MSVILYSEINIICILILLLLTYRLHCSSFLQEQRRRFYWVLLSNIIFFSVDLCWSLVSTQTLPAIIPLNWFLNIIYFSLCGFCSFTWFCYSEVQLNSSLLKSFKSCFICALPALILMILSILSVRTGWLFDIDSQNVYQRGPLYFVQLIVTYGYVAFSTIKALWLSVKTSIYAKKIEYRTMALFVVPPLITGTMQIFLPGVPLFCVGITLGLLYVFISLQEQQISIDPLTKLNNRTQLRQCLSTKIQHFSQDKVLYLLMLDIDYFKQINDQYGHLEGDRALQLVSDALLQTCYKKNYFTARYGGDELMVLCELNVDEKIESVIENIQEALRCIQTPFPLSVSIGCAQYVSSIKTDLDFIKAADNELYIKKKARKS